MIKIALTTFVQFLLNYINIILVEQVNENYFFI
jgi:hypothetical protein